MWKYLDLVKISTFRGYYPDLVKISTLLGYYPHFVDISALCGYDMHFGEISTFRGYDPHFVDTIDIGQNTSYLARNVRHVVYSFVLVVDIVYIVRAMRYLARNFCPIFRIYSSSESDWYMCTSSPQGYYSHVLPPCRGSIFVDMVLYLV